jgi:hypothetical protein
MLQLLFIYHYFLFYNGWTHYAILLCLIVLLLYHWQSMIELSRTQDEEVGDGTTSVIVLGTHGFSFL